jgi:hypothetical protein
LGTLAAGKTGSQHFPTIGVCAVDAPARPPILNILRSTVGMLRPQSADGFVAFMPGHPEIHQHMRRLAC